MTRGLFLDLFSPGKYEMPVEIIFQTDGESGCCQVMTRRRRLSSRAAPCPALM